MRLPPDRFDDLRALAKALARAQRQTADPEPYVPNVRRRSGARALVLVVTLTAAVALFAAPTWLPCMLRDCTTPPTPVSTIPDRVAVVMARPEPPPDADVRPPTEWRVPPTPTRRAGAEKPRALANAPGERARADTASAPSLSGGWMITNAIDATSHHEFAGLRIRFRIHLEQRGDRITGRGTKFSVDDKPVPRRQQTRIVLAGTVRDGEALVRFVEHGTRRRSTGGFRWRISPDGKRLEGTFDSSAAATSGRSHATRER